MTRKILKYFFAAGVGSMLFTSCIKNNVTELTTQGTTYLKILEGPENKLFFEPFAGTKQVTLASVRRDANSEAELNKPVTITVRVDTAGIRAYNQAHNESFQLLPDSLFTLVGNSFTKTGNLTYQTTMQPGEFGKEFTINLNGSKWDLSKKYAFPLVFENTGGLKVSNVGTDVFTSISIKNKYDGIYSVESGSVTRYTAPGAPAGDALSGDLKGNPDVTLATVGTSTVEISGLQWAYGNNSGVGGIANLRATVDPVTNEVTMFSLGNPSLANWEGKENRYDPATKTFYLNFRWNPTANRREYSIVLKYKGPR